jgi:hypothetical protein
MAVLLKLPKREPRVNDYEDLHEPTKHAGFHCDHTDFDGTEVGLDSISIGLDRAQIILDYAKVCFDCLDILALVHFHKRY